MTHPSRRLDDEVHQRVRLGILVILHESGRADFTYLRDALELTAGNLSRNLTRLEGAGLISSEKVADGTRPRTWLSITPAGRAALSEEIAALRELIAGVGPRTAPATAPPSARPGLHSATG
ncbi:MAG: transcriptional regulator [Solirubrobacterales bacterium]|nr:transcriptional regulator [Solirubrobacterales bacterium]